MTNPHSHLRRSVAVASLAALILACSSSTGPASVESVIVHQAMWKDQKLTNYSYTYQFRAFNAFANQPLRLEVRGDTVRSVIILATGDSIDPTYFPTIDAIFDRALHAAQNGSLTRIAFDPVRSYPTLIDYEAFPDALSFEQVSGLESLP